MGINQRKSIFSLWIEFQFFDGPRNILKAWKNFLLFNINYFSVPFLMKTLFSYWRRYSLSYGRVISFSRYFEVFVFNMMSRLTGFVLKIFLIFIWLLTEVMMIFTGLIILSLWLILPFLLIVGFFYGFGLLF